MRVAWVVPCERLIEQPEAGSIADGFALTEAVVESLPTVIHLTLAIRLLVTKDDLSKSYRVVFDVVGPAKEVVHTHGGPLQLGLVSPLFQTQFENGEEIATDSSGVLEFEVHTTGPHSIIVSVDGAAAPPVPLWVTMGG